MQSDSLSTKYMPKSFDEMIGLKGPKTIFKKHIADKKPAPLYLLHGGSGLGKTASAICFAREINCTCDELGDDQTTPCQTCESDHQLRNPNIYRYYNCATVDKAAIAEIRGLSSYSCLLNIFVVILDEAHNIPLKLQAALLDTFESAKNVCFILATTNDDAILPAIKNRACSIYFQRPTESELEGHLTKICELEGKKVDKDIINAISKYSNYSVRHSLNNLGTLFDTWNQELLDSIKPSDIPFLMKGKKPGPRNRLKESVRSVVWYMFHGLINESIDTVVSTLTNSNSKHFVHEMLISLQICLLHKTNTVSQKSFLSVDERSFLIKVAKVLDADTSIKTEDICNIINIWIACLGMLKKFDSPGSKLPIYQAIVASTNSLKKGQ